jgi:hypothetical protein
LAELETAGYLELRTGSPVNAWFVELRDDSNQPVPLDDLAEGTVNRLSSSDGRLTVTDNAGTQTITFALELTSSDVGASPGSPVTIEGSVLYAAVSGGDALTAVEAFDPFVFSAEEDTATISHAVEVPQQA